MPTNPVTYRVSPEVNAELKRLAEVHGGVDKALRVLLAVTNTDEASDSQSQASRIVEAAMERLRDADTEFDQRRENMRERMKRGARAFKGPLLKPSERKKS